MRHYEEVLRSGGAPRAIAYHEHGFISALLDGHHKATAAARLGRTVNCLTIIPYSGFSTGNLYTIGGCSGAVWFGGIKVPAAEVECFEELRRRTEELRENPPITDLRIQDYPLLSGRQSGLDVSGYPTISELARRYSGG